MPELSVDLDVVVRFAPTVGEQAGTLRNLAAWLPANDSDLGVGLSKAAESFENVATSVNTFVQDMLDVGQIAVIGWRGTADGAERAIFSAAERAANREAENATIAAGFFAAIKAGPKPSYPPLNAGYIWELQSFPNGRGGTFSEWVEVPGPGVPLPPASSPDKGKQWLLINTRSGYCYVQVPIAPTDEPPEDSRWVLKVRNGVRYWTFEYLPGQAPNLGGMHVGDASAIRKQLSSQAPDAAIYLSDEYFDPKELAMVDALLLHYRRGAPYPRDIALGESFLTASDFEGLLDEICGDVDWRGGSSRNWYEGQGVDRGQRFEVNGQQFASVGSYITISGGPHAGYYAVSMDVTEPGDGLWPYNMPLYGYLPGDTITYHQHKDPPKNDTQRRQLESDGFTKQTIKGKEVWISSTKVTVGGTASAPIPGMFPINMPYTTGADSTIQRFGYQVGGFVADAGTLAAYPFAAGTSTIYEVGDGIFGDGFNVVDIVNNTNKVARTMGNIEGSLITDTINGLDLPRAIRSRNPVAIAWTTFQIVSTVLPLLKLGQTAAAARILSTARMQAQAAGADAVAVFDNALEAAMANADNLAGAGAGGVPLRDAGHIDLGRIFGRSADDGLHNSVGTPQFGDVLRSISNSDYLPHVLWGDLLANPAQARVGETGLDLAVEGAHTTAAFGSPAAVVKGQQLDGAFTGALDEDAAQFLASVGVDTRDLRIRGTVGKIKQSGVIQVRDVQVGYVDQAGEWIVVGRKRADSSLWPHDLSTAEITALTRQAETSALADIASGAVIPVPKAGGENWFEALHVIVTDSLGRDIRVRLLYNGVGFNSIFPPA